MKDKRWPYKEAMELASMLRDTLHPVIERVEIVGSLRRKKDEVGDIELLFIPKLEERPEGLFDKVKVDLADEMLNDMLACGQLQKRPSKTGVFSWGEKNKLSIHVPSGIAVDWFSTNEDCWWNSLVCRTGGKENNLMITTTAQQRGWSFEAYGSGFMEIYGLDSWRSHHQTTSERDVYEFIGLPYLEPWQRK